MKTSLTKPGYLLVAPDAASLNRDAAKEFSACAQAAIAQNGRFTVALSGGNTPRSVYALLADEYRESVPWAKTFVFFGDERHVPPEHTDSNYRMARESLLTKVPLPEQNIYRVKAEWDATAAADDYQRRLQEFFELKPGEWPRFDLVLLGIGDDGHTASLFPGSAALQERTRLVVANWVEKFNAYRITLTFPVLNHAANVLFMVSGDSKAAILQKVFSSDGAICPARQVVPSDGRMVWIADRPAAALLPH